MEEQEILELIENIEGTRYLCGLVDTVHMKANIVDFLDVSESAIKDQLQEDYIHMYEMIYYSNAMEFLREEDASLQTSMELASDMGLETHNLTSETLATILMQQLASEELYSL